MDLSSSSSATNVSFARKAIHSSCLQWWLIFCHGMIAVPSEFLCDVMNESRSVKKIKFDYNIYMGFHTSRLWNKLDYFSIGRYIVVVKPLKYLTLMKRHLVNQMVLISWGIHFLFNLIVLSRNSIQSIVSAAICICFLR